MAIDPNSIVRDAKGRLLKRPVGSGRPKGRGNKVTTAVREMVRMALDKAGGVDYLVEQAHKEPRAFLSLVGRTLPKEVTAEVGTTLESLLAASYAAGERKGLESGHARDVIDVPAKPKLPIEDSRDAPDS